MIVAATRTPPRHWAFAALAWAAGWAAMLWLDGRVDLANQAMVLVLASAVAALWCPVPVSLLASAVSVLGFDLLFVPPRGVLSVELGQHGLLLGAMCGVNWIVAALMAGQRSQAERSRRQLAEAEQLRSLGDALRDAAEPITHAGMLRDALAGLVDAPVALLVLRDGLPERNDAEAAVLLGEVDADGQAGLWHSLRQGHALGPGTGRHEQLDRWYLPLRGRAISLGAALLPLPAAGRDLPDRRLHAQSLCDQMGLALQRRLASQAERDAREQAQLQSVRNALLAAISHDFRTPLATILGAASSLQDQSDRLSAAQRQRLSATIADEARQLSRLTDNTLQLARLDAPGVALKLDWESAEEIVGTVLRRARQRMPDGDPQRRVRARLEPGLPLVRCDALLLTQLLDNLVDNALKYSPEGEPIEILVRRLGDEIVLSVRDRGPGVPPAWRERIFEVFQRGEGGPSEPGARAGAGVGLAVCRAIARAHGGELRLRARGHGGCSFECHLPAVEPPDMSEAA